ncbi:hypothetical protein PMAYCL1PPCAC_08887, partial [Pristionchus mayeri]
SSEIMLWEAAIVAAVGVLALKYFGCFDTPEVSISENPSAFAGGLTVYYKYHVGAFSGAYSISRDIMNLIPNKVARGFGIFYDDPNTVPEHLHKTAVGVIVKVGSEDLVKPEIIEMLKERGLKKMEIPAVYRSITSSCSMNIACAVLPDSLNPIVKMYRAIEEYAKSNSLCMSMVMELYALDSSLITVHFPLDNREGFVVPE